ncbi:uncharacterized protein LOC122062176 isoform X1 [Macadamia integrifolia]|uniref:uncharacterized protein LOC122062176 isoform X1 n=1 Tax=Macadamia integrifolia TaxID=60698 RepID=UPI001C52FFFF|nr:uncharacterized protein LOC122062176 isoform X1 [Macadamia integrifolia]
MTGAQAMKRIPLIKFPQRHPKPSGSASQLETASTVGGAHSTFFSSSGALGAPTNASVGGKASDQPKRTPVSDREIEAILLGGCI